MGTEWTEEEALARVVLRSAIYNSIVAEPNVPSKGRKLWHKMERRKNSSYW